jgi:L-amino acid N-acyltransferase YncA
MSIKQALQLVISILGTCSLEGAHVRSFIPCKDYVRLSAICSHHWKKLGEFDEACSTILEPTMYGIAKRAPEFRDMKIKVLEENGTIIGFISYCDLKQVPPLFELLQIAIDPAHEGKGHETVLLEALTSELKVQDVTAVISRVKKDDAAALDWHKQQGFFVLGKDEKAQSCFEAKYFYEAAAYDYVPMKLNLKVSPVCISGICESFVQHKEGILKKCISPEAREEVAQILQLIRVRNPVQHALVIKTLDVFPLEAGLSFDRLQVKKILYRYLQELGRDYSSDSLRKKAVYTYANVILGCKPLTAQAKTYLARLFDTIQGYTNDSVTLDIIMESLGIRLEDIDLDLF